MNERIETDTNPVADNVDTDRDQAQESPQSLNERGAMRSRRPTSEAFRNFIGSNWGPRDSSGIARSEVADYLPARHQRISEAFPGERLVIPAGGLKVRNNDCDYRFRAHSAFVHTSGLGGEREPDAVVVIEPTADSGYQATLFFKPRASRSSEEFYADSRYGEFWVGARPSLEEMETTTGLHCAHIDTLPDALAKDAGQVQLRVVREASAEVTALVDQVRQQAGLRFGEDAHEIDDELAQELSEMRLCKDAYERSQIALAVDVTYQGFDEIIRALPRAVGHRRGERVIEGAFGARAREEGNGLGYDTIAAAGNHANTLHWIDNDGPVKPGDLVLVDAGVEVDSLYTADITRTLPVDGKFTPIQAQVYNAVLEACEAALHAANQPGCVFRQIHEAAMEVIAHHLEDWGILPVSAQESLSPEGQQHRRWMPHGTSHHLGLDVHDCAQARQEMYLDAKLEPGMVFTIEPGLYFRADDLAVPEQFRGIGVRIEDDIIVNEDGSVTRLSESIPRTVTDVEAWIARVQQASGADSN